MWISLCIYLGFFIVFIKKLKIRQDKIKYQLILQKYSLKKSVKNLCTKNFYTKLSTMNLYSIKLSKNDIIYNIKMDIIQ